MLIKVKDWLWIDDGAWVDDSVQFTEGELTTVNWGTRIIGDVKIGQGVLISNNVVITSNSHGFGEGEWIRKQSTTSIQTVIEDDVFIGANSVILSGALLKRGCVIGAGSVVTECKIIPENEIWGGVPAKYLKIRT